MQASTFSQSVPYCTDGYYAKGVHFVPGDYFHTGITDISGAGNIIVFLSTAYQKIYFSSSFPGHTFSPYSIK